MPPGVAPDLPSGSSTAVFPVMSSEGRPLPVLRRTEGSVHHMGGMSFTQELKAPTKAETGMAGRGQPPSKKMIFERADCSRMRRSGAYSSEEYHCRACSGVGKRSKYEAVLERPVAFHDLHLRRTGEELAFVRVDFRNHVLRVACQAFVIGPLDVDENVPSHFTSSSRKSDGSRGNPSTGSGRAASRYMLPNRARCRR
jgi:hypothetical protein